jgi:hypothetical protein
MRGRRSFRRKPATVDRQELTQVLGKEEEKKKIETEDRQAGAG